MKSNNHWICISVKHGICICKATEPTDSCLYYDNMFTLERNLVRNNAFIRKHRSCVNTIFWPMLTGEKPVYNVIQYTLTEKRTQQQQIKTVWLCFFLLVYCIYNIFKQLKSILFSKIIQVWHLPVYLSAGLLRISYFAQNITFQW